MKASLVSSGTAPEIAAAVIPDPFNPDTFRVSQDYLSTAQVKRVLTTIKVGKPLKEWFIRVHPDSNFRMGAAVIDLKDESETYIVLPAMTHHLEGLVQHRMLFTAITRQGIPFVWPVKLPDSEGKLDTWNQSALAAASKAEKQWVSLRANRAAGAYDTFVALGELPEPEWGELPKFSEVLRLAFNGKIIDKPDHPVIKRLRGEI